MAADYNRICDGIAKVFPDFGEFDARVRMPSGFRLKVGASDQVWNTPDRAL